VNRKSRELRGSFLFWSSAEGFDVLAVVCYLLAFIPRIKGFTTVPPQPPQVKLVNTPEYRENYSNSVQVRVSVWDFFLAFGTLRNQTPEEVEVANFQGIYLSPQQAKALLMILQQNVSQYEHAFGEIKLDPQFAQAGSVN
jgi:flagellar protein FlaG